MRMEFGFEKCAMLMMKKWKRETKETIELPNVKTLGVKESYKNLGILEADTIK